MSIGSQSKDINIPVQCLRITKDQSYHCQVNRQPIQWTSTTWNIVCTFCIAREASHSKWIDVASNSPNKDNSRQCIVVFIIVILLTTLLLDSSIDKQTLVWLDIHILSVECEYFHQCSWHCQLESWVIVKFTKCHGVRLDNWHNSVEKTKGVLYKIKPYQTLS